MNRNRADFAHAEMRHGDFHLRKDDRQLFANYVELSPGGGGTGNMARVRKSASVVETPVYSEPRLWKITVEFSGPRATPALPLTPWPPSLGALYSVRITTRTALDRDKVVDVGAEELYPLDSIPVGGMQSFQGRFVHGHQVGIAAEAIGPETSTAVVGVQVSVVPVEAGDRDAYGNAVMGEFAQLGTSQVFLRPNKRRRQFFVQNLGSSALFVAFNEAATIPPTSPPHRTSIVLPVGGIYESLRDTYQGFVSGVWAADGGSAEDVAIVTEGT